MARRKILGPPIWAIAIWSLSIACLADPVPVSVVQPERSEVREALQLSGTVNALQRASVSVRVDGLVAEALVDAGDRVLADQLLLRQDAALAELEYRQAQAARAEAQAGADEAQRLFSEAERLAANNHISDNEVNSRRAELALAEAGLAAAKAREAYAAAVVDRHQLLAPFAGVISERRVDKGEWLARGAAAFELVSLETLRLDVDVPQERFTEISDSTPVTICPDMLPDQCGEGRITSIVPVSNAANRTFRVRIANADGKLKLLPGTSATAQLAIGGGEQRQLVLPRDALLRHPDGNFSVFVLENGRAQRRAVEIGRESAGKVVIRHGITAYDRVIVRGNDVLSEGQAVSLSRDGDGSR